MDYNTLVVLSGTGLLGACAGLFGSFAVLRRRALTGDALAHAALPGVCLAFILAGGKSLPLMLLGALGTGLLGIAIIAALRLRTRIKEDAAIGVVLSGFFGAGIVLSQLIQDRWSTGSKAGLDSFIFGKTAGMIASDVYLIGGVSLAGLLTIALFFKEFQTVAFDPGFAKARGLPALTLDFLMMGLVAVTTAVGLPAVGVLLMAALLIMPAASARFWTDRLGHVMGLGAIFGATIGASGALLSAETSLPAGPMIVMCGTLLFLVSVFFAPRRGAISALWTQRQSRRSYEVRELLRIAYSVAIAASAKVDDSLALDSLLKAKSWSRSRLLDAARRAAKSGSAILGDQETLKLTPAGWERGATEARNHELWRQFLAEHPEQATAMAGLDVMALDALSPAAIETLDGFAKSSRDRNPQREAVA